MTTQLTDWIAGHGLVAVFVLMAIDAVFPAGGELVMLFAGALAAGAIAGHDGPSLVAVIVTGTLGYLAGSIGGWAIGRAGGPPLIERHGRWLHLGPERFQRAERWFGRYGSGFVLFGRLTPLVRSFVSIPAGVLEYPFGRYVLLSSIASFIWCLAFAVAGHALSSNWDSVHRAFRYADYVAVLAVLALAAAVLVRLRRPGAGSAAAHDAAVERPAPGRDERDPGASGT
jgi:membrane protein DedA with SNARE-associated domain